MKYTIRTKIYYLDRPDVYKSKDIRSIFEKVREYFGVVDIDLVLENLKPIFDYTRMLPRGIEGIGVAKWLRDFGAGENGWWAREDRTLEILLCPPIQENKYSSAIPSSIERYPSIDRMWAIATASPVLETIIDKRDTKNASAVFISKAIAYGFCGEPVNKESGLACRNIERWSYWEKGLSFSKSTKKLMHSWFKDVGWNN